jgi:hypothetical protein
MTVTFTPGLEKLGAQLLAKKQEEAARKGDSVWDAYLRWVGLCFCGSVCLFNEGLLHMLYVIGAQLVAQLCVSASIAQWFPIFQEALFVDHARCRVCLSLLHLFCNGSCAWGCGWACVSIYHTILLHINTLRLYLLAFHLPAAHARLSCTCLPQVSCSEAPCPQDSIVCC